MDFVKSLMSTPRVRRAAPTQDHATPRFSPYRRPPPPARTEGASPMRYLKKLIKSISPGRQAEEENTEEEVEDVENVAIDQNAVSAEGPSEVRPEGQEESAQPKEPVDRLPLESFNPYSARTPEPGPSGSASPENHPQNASSELPSEAKPQLENPFDPPADQTLGSRKRTHVDLTIDQAPPEPRSTPDPMVLRKRVIIRRKPIRYFGPGFNSRPVGGTTYSRKQQLPAALRGEEDGPDAKRRRTLKDYPSSSRGSSPFGRDKGKKPVYATQDDADNWVPPEEGFTRSTSTRPVPSGVSAFLQSLQSKAPETTPKPPVSGSETGITPPITAPKTSATTVFTPTIAPVRGTPTVSVAPTASTAAAPSTTGTTGGFDWGAAGMARTAPSGWTCEACFVSNANTATKCVSCETTKPGSTQSTSGAPPSASRSTTGGFNWTAAGIAPAASSGWKCDVCSVSNTDTATKCASCEEPKPGSAKTTSGAPPSASGSTTAGFNWAAAGVAAPAAGNKWKCNVCDVSNAAEAKKCASCETEKPLGEGKGASISSAAPAAGSSGGFNWAAAGKTATVAGQVSGWTCDACLVTNTGDDTQCKACTTERPQQKSTGSTSTTQASTPAVPPAPFSFGIPGGGGGGIGSGTGGVTQFNFGGKAVGGQTSFGVSFTAPSATTTFSFGGTTIDAGSSTTTPSLPALKPPVPTETPKPQPSQASESTPAASTPAPTSVGSISRSTPAQPIPFIMPATLSPSGSKDVDGPHAPPIAFTIPGREKDKPTETETAPEAIETGTSNFIKFPSKPTKPIETDTSSKPAGGKQPLTVDISAKKDNTEPANEADLTSPVTPATPHMPTVAPNEFGKNEVWQESAMLTEEEEHEFEFDFF
ncbi:hypothetical protein HK097_000115 [Rhizophlyctis rosea]|uniref:Nuclear pore complex protein Nup153 n=1 Tax=Rhizophlyctis rosea TaxID=64517 RepID=A0AAD5S5V4_9FUNG|nr:hypothetical protein HK097_000115 [Rhizophlyctis rosea]